MKPSKGYKVIPVGHTLSATSIVTGATLLSFGKLPTASTLVAMLILYVISILGITLGYLMILCLKYLRLVDNVYIPSQAGQKSKRCR